jgi:hypothetical protein
MLLIQQAYLANLAFIGWLLFVLVSTEAFAANHTYKP